MGEGVDQQIVHSFIAFGLDGGRAVGEGLLDEGDDVGFGLVLIAFGIFFGGRLFPHRQVSKVIVRTGHVEKLFGEAALCGRGLEIEFVLGGVFGHGDELSSYLVPGFEHGLGGGGRGFDGGFFLHGVLGAGRKSEDCGGEDGGGYERSVHHWEDPLEWIGGRNWNWTAREWESERTASGCFAKDD